MIADLQSERMDEQRAQLPGVAGRRPTPNGTASGSSKSSAVANSHVSQPQLHLRRHQLPAASDDAFLDMLIRCQVNRRKSRDPICVGCVFVDILIAGRLYIYNSVHCWSPLYSGNKSLEIRFYFALKYVHFKLPNIELAWVCSTMCFFLN